LKTVFVDTGAWMAMADADDPVHAATRRKRDELLRGGSLFVSSDYVLDETLTLIRMRLGIDAASKWWSQIEGSSRLRWEQIDPMRAEKARRWFFQWKDKRFSFTDCTSFVVMKELHARLVLTTDDNFRQAGFEIVP
jgi:predicted nucleic acid-binding protein